MPPYSIILLFSEKISTPCSGSIKQQTNHTRLPPQYFRINDKDTSFHVSIDLITLYLSPKNFVKFFVIANTIPSWLLEVLILMSRLLENAIAGQKSDLSLSYRYFYHYPQAEGNYSSSTQHFFGNVFSPAEEKGDDTLQNIDQRWVS